METHEHGLARGVLTGGESAGAAGEAEINGWGGGEMLRPWPGEKLRQGPGGVGRESRGQSQRVIGRGS
jgi:hypothetical protein